MIKDLEDDVPPLVNPNYSHNKNCTFASTTIKSYLDIIEMSN